MTAKTYYLLSGEGEQGTWQVMEMTPDGIKKQLRQERAGGDRWARAIEDAFETADGLGWAGIDVETREVHALPSDLLQA